MAPDFDLPVLIGGVKKRFHLREELKQRNVVLAFYPCNWKESSARQLSNIRRSANNLMHGVRQSLAYRSTPS